MSSYTYDRHRDGDDDHHGDGHDDLACLNIQAVTQWGMCHKIAFPSKQSSCTMFVGFHDEIVLPVMQDHIVSPCDVMAVSL